MKIKRSELKDGGGGRLHVPDWDIERRVKEVIDELNGGRADVFITSGDSFIYGWVDEVNGVVEIYVTRINQHLSNIWND